MKIIEIIEINYKIKYILLNIYIKNIYITIILIIILIKKYIFCLRNIINLFIIYKNFIYYT